MGKKRVHLNTMEREPQVELPVFELGVKTLKISCEGGASQGALWPFPRVLYVHEGSGQVVRASGVARLIRLRMESDFEKALRLHGDAPF